MAKSRKWSITAKRDEDVPVIIHPDALVTFTNKNGSINVYVDNERVWATSNSGKLVILPHTPTAIELAEQKYERQ